MFLRLGHAETDEQLQNIISKFLPPVLLKLSSTQEGVRKKVRMQSTVPVHCSHQAEGNGTKILFGAFCEEIYSFRKWYCEPDREKEDSHCLCKQGVLFMCDFCTCRLYLLLLEASLL